MASREVVARSPGSTRRNIQRAGRSTRGRRVAASPLNRIASGIGRPCRRQIERAPNSSTMRARPTRRRPEISKLWDARRKSAWRCPPRFVAAARHKGQSAGRAVRRTQAVEVVARISMPRTASAIWPSWLRQLHRFTLVLLSRRLRCVARSAISIGERRGDAGMQRAAAGDLRLSPRRLVVVAVCRSTSRCSSRSSRSVVSISTSHSSHIGTQGCDQAVTS